MRFGMDEVYAFPEDMLLESQRMHCRERLQGFDLIRSNPRICGYNLTGLLDHVFSGEGLWTFWREWKPGIVDALQDGWAPLRWCLFVRPRHGYTGRPVHVEAVLATEDVLPPGDYPIQLRIMGPEGLAREDTTSLTIPEAAPGEDPPLAIPVYAGDITLEGPPGEYCFAANLESGGAPAGGRLDFRLSDPVKSLPMKETVTVWGISQEIQDWLESHGVACKAFDAGPGEASQVVLVGNPNQIQAEAADWIELLRQVARGSVALFLDPGAFKRGDDSVGWLPLENKGRGYEFSDWLYHKEPVAKSHPVFRGLQKQGIMDWEYYGPIIPRYFFEGQDTPNETMAAAFALCHSSQPDGYTAGVLLCSYKFGHGAFFLNSLKILENLDSHPAADRLLLNLIEYAAGMTGGPLTDLPADFDQRIAAFGYR
jgi:hypothetical protein